MTDAVVLRRGERVRIGELVYRVVMVNDCRAHCVALVRERVEFRDVRTGARRRHEIDIAPTALVERVTTRATRA